jgi:hypothetical protein
MVSPVAAGVPASPATAGSAVVAASALVAGSTDRLRLGVPLAETVGVRVLANG